MHAHFQELLDIRDGAPVDSTVLQHIGQCDECGRELARLTTLKGELRQLPGFEPPARAWNGIRERMERQPSRRPSRAPAFALAASVLVAVLVLPMIHRSQELPPGDFSSAVNPANAIPEAASESVGSLMQRSQRLDAVLQVLPRRPQVERAGTSATIDELQSRIQMLDVQLSAASGEQRHDDAQRLWNARVELMNSLVHVRYAEAAANADLSEPSSNLGAI
jgi:hypothetical protein